MAEIILVHGIDQQQKPHWPEAARNAGKWDLIIGNQEWHREQRVRCKFNFMSSKPAESKSLIPRLRSWKSSVLMHLSWHPIHFLTASVPELWPYPPDMELRRATLGANTFWMAASSVTGRACQRCIVCL